MDKRQKVYCDEVLRFRKVLNLTSVKDPETFYNTFVTPSILLGKWIEKDSVVLDIGSGMGVPGIPLLIDRDDISAILVERRKKRAEFLRHLVRKMKLNSEVYDADINELEPLGATVCVARAVSDIATLIAMCNKHIVKGGKVVLPVPDDVELPVVNGWLLEDEFRTVNSQRVVCYIKSNNEDGGVSRET